MADLVQRLDHPLLGDSYLATLFATGVVFGLAGWGVLMGLLVGVVAGVPAIAVVAGVLRARRTRLIACVALGLLIAALACAWIGWPGALVGAAIVGFTGLRSRARERRWRASDPAAAAIGEAR